MLLPIATSLLRICLRSIAPGKGGKNSKPNKQASIKEAPTDRRPGLGLPNHHLVPPCGWDGGVNGSVLGKA